jgi:ATP-dependent Clp protease ATP-binding subunit ClpC
MLLQIMDEGKLTDSFGRRVDFRNVILIMTSNLGTASITGTGGFGFRQKTEDSDYDAMKETLAKEVEKYFRPEFLNRLDDIIVFRSLTKEDLKQIIDLEMRYIKERLTTRGVTLELSEEAKDWLLKTDYNLEFGARPIKRALERYIEDPLAEDILRGCFEGKNYVVVKVKEDHLHFDAQEPACPSENEEEDKKKTGTTTKEEAEVG